MKKWQRTTLMVSVVIGVLAAAGWGYYRYTYPYGSSHRCSKALASQILNYADNHGGRFPSSEQPDALGLSAIIDDNPFTLELIVGKAGDLEKAKEFHQKHGYLKPEHSSWHYVSGLTTADTDKAILWDKIPLGHSGERTNRNTREVIMVNGAVKAIPESEWDDFLKAQKPDQ
ncbi:MAG: hypothetical protein AB8F34_14980 [Akkermansiaceae bacterium]